MMFILQTVINEPLPATLAKPDEIVRTEHYKTTTGAAHDVKFLGGPYGNRDPDYKKAPGHWKVDYVKDLHEKVCILVKNNLMCCDVVKCLTFDSCRMRNTFKKDGL